MLNQIKNCNTITIITASFEKKIVVKLSGSECNCFHVLFLYSICVILAASLITQIEYKNNTWKQLHSLPLSFTTIFFSKLAVIIVMVLQFFIWFNIGIYLSALIPYLLVSGV